MVTLLLEKLFHLKPWEHAAPGNEGEVEAGEADKAGEEGESQARTSGHTGQESQCLLGAMWSLRRHG